MEYVINVDSEKENAPPDTLMFLQQQKIGLEEQLASFKLKLVVEKPSGAQICSSCCGWKLAASKGGKAHVCSNRQHSFANELPIKKFKSSCR